MNGPTQSQSSQANNQLAQQLSQAQSEGLRKHQESKQPKKGYNIFWLLKVPEFSVVSYMSGNIDSVTGTFIENIKLPGLLNHLNLPPPSAAYMGNFAPFEQKNLDSLIQGLKSNEPLDKEGGGGGDYAHEDHHSRQNHGNDHQHDHSNHHRYDDQMHQNSRNYNMHDRNQHYGTGNHQQDTRPDIGQIYQQLNHADQQRYQKNMPPPSRRPA